MLNTIKNALHFLSFEAAYERNRKSRRAYVEEYLSQSVDRFDLERRERELERGGYFH